MLISEYFESAVKQRSAAFRISDYLSDKDADYRIFYNVDSLDGSTLERKLFVDNELPKIFDSIMLKKYYTPGFFKDDKYLLVKLEGRLKEYEDIGEDNVDYDNKSNFVDESVALKIQEKYLKFLSDNIHKEFKKIQDDKKLVDRR